jgi:hypothetical protein
MQKKARIAMTAGVTLGAIQFAAHDASQEPVSQSIGANGICIGEEGTLAAGLTVTIDTTLTPMSTLLTARVDTDRRRQGVQISLPFDLDLGWQSYVIAPGNMYNGNRFIVSPQPYCPYPLTEGVTPDGPIIITDVPRLTSDSGYRAEFAANALAIPAIGVYDPARKQGFVIGVEVYGDWGVTGVNLQTLPGKPVRAEVCLPVMRRRRYRFCDWIDVDNEPGMVIEPDKPIRCDIRITPASAESIPAFVRQIAEYGFTCRSRNACRTVMSFADAAELVESKLDAHNWDEANGYYQTQMGGILQTGWAGGGVTMFAMACSKNPGRYRRAIRMLDTICRGAVSPSGYFHGIYDGVHWRSFGFKRPGCRAFSLIRRSLDCTRDVLKTLALVRSRGEAVDSAWESAAKRNLDAMVDTAARFGHLGYTVDRDTGDVLWGDSACGVFGIEPLTHGAKWFNNSKYLNTAVKLAEYYVSRFLEKGYTCGGVGDALMSVDSESNYALLSGLVHLYAATGTAEHLEWARQAADLFSTWVLCYDAKLPADSPLGKLGIHPQGAVFANIQNQHGAPGICIASGRELLTLYELTGEERYIRQLEDIAHCIPQMIVRPGQEEIWGDLPPGAISERLMTMDGMEPCGHTSRISTWSEIALLLSACELPESLLHRS